MASLQRPPEEYDLVILGGGTGSTIAARTFAGEGKRVAVIDRKYIGGSCPNIACLPSKNLIHSAKVASYFQRAREFGIVQDGFTVDMPGVRDRKRKMVTGMNEIYPENYRRTGAENVDSLTTAKAIAVKDPTAIEHRKTVDVHSWEDPPGIGVEYFQPRKLDPKTPENMKVHPLCMAYQSSTKRV